MGTKKGMVRKTARKAYVKKAGYGKTMKAKSGLKKPGKTQKPKSSQKGLKSLPTAVRNKMGFAKKGGSTRKCKSGCK